MSASFYRLEPFGKSNPPRADVVAALHMQLLPTSPASRLGLHVLEQFYYTVLPRSGLVFGAVAFVKDEPAGFVVATDDSDGFMSRGVRDHWGDLLRTLPSLVTRQSHLRLGSAFVEVLRLMISRARKSGAEPIGEILSMGVRSEFRDSAFVRDTRLLIAHDLLGAALVGLESKGVTRARTVIDTDNLPAQFLYKNLGWCLERTQVPGWKTPSVEFTIDLTRTNE